MEKFWRIWQLSVHLPFLVLLQREVSQWSQNYF
jgi:hypothetical protein